ncbi:Fungal-specific transcription factor-containing protein [Venustampulla echinocandica]|uniref:Fungal-specific transcription factor-containing protein n=1 Tax=Venustampulla echinocandica TaxID=2656787 RepID=A0A370TUK3_9HELO|nr:Fungal-specific transcription factor-containing protein [Venustampulla echinocandica]RDL39211.1 Fungal-specific transcription factor-containing protein [Venustampulla echinocandica]
MPGILPMKVIKVGSSSQSRIAQACDRCRSKKIRCDGIRPCCSQCSNVGFECKTSDKLSRRAFPRGYTESLEERVRSLECEVRELKDLLDEKDEKIDMLSRMHSNRRPSASSISPNPPAEVRTETSTTPPKDDVFRVQASPLLLGAENSDSYFMGASSGRAFVDAFKRRVQESGKSLAGFNTDAFLNIQGDTTSLSQVPAPDMPTTPPRMFSDRCVNVFFQEWAPLFPVLHKPTFLRLYEDYMSNPAQGLDDHKLAQLHLVFGIAGMSSEVPDREQIALCEYQWRSSLEAVLMDNSLATLQCLILALIYCVTKADYNRLQHYKGIAVGLSHRLGLHQSQKRFSFGALTIETRKKVFWTLYTLDCFSAASLGLPKLLKEEDIHAEYPSDTDDEYVTEKGFQPTLPGEYTKISSALALFRVSRILSKVLDQNYPAAAAHELSLQSLNALENELNDWSEKLPAHLKLTFVQDKPSTDITGSRSALLSLSYYYIRTLIHRPAVGSTLGHKTSPSVISIADSSKHVIQIIQLLEERSMSFSFCLNKNEMLTLCGLSLLYQGLDLKQEGKLMQDGHRLVGVVIKYLEKASAPGGADFKRLAISMINMHSHSKQPPARSPNSMAAPPSTKSTPSPSVSKQQIRPQVFRNPSASMSESDLLSQQEKLRRATLPNLSMQRPDTYAHSRASIDSTHSESLLPQRDNRASISHPQTMLKPRIKSERPPNLDYLSLSNTPASQPQSPIVSRTQVSSHSSRTPTYSTSASASTPAYSNPKPATTNLTEWEALLGSLDGGQTNLYDAIYGGPALSLPETAQSNYAQSNYSDWSPDSAWDMTSLSMADVNTGTPGAARSVLSFSEESLSSVDELSGSDLGLVQCLGGRISNFGVITGGGYRLKFGCVQGVAAMLDAVGVTGAGSGTE